MNTISCPKDELVRSHAVIRCHAGIPKIEALTTACHVEPTTRERLQLSRTFATDLRIRERPSRLERIVTCTPVPTTLVNSLALV